VAVGAVHDALSRLTQHQGKHSCVLRVSKSTDKVCVWCRVVVAVDVLFACVIGTDHTDTCTHICERLWC
jgi:hypothetical protein